MFHVSYMMFGLIVTNGEFEMTTLIHVIMTWQQQLVHLHNVSLLMQIRQMTTIPYIAVLDWLLVSWLICCHDQSRLFAQR